MCEVDDTILTGVDGHVFVITLNRPERLNAISAELSEEFLAAMRRFDKDPSLRVAVITGAGRAFCAGRDLRQRAEEQAEPASPGSELAGFLGARDEERMYTFSTNKPLIAAVNGHCLGGGFEIALWCDIRIASEAASFGLPEIKRGFFPGGGGPQRIARNVPQSLAMEMLLTGDPIDAAAALKAGLVSRVVAPDELMPAALGVAHAIAGNAPLAVRAVKELYAQSRDAPLSDAMRFGAALRWMVGQTDDAKEGPRAFSEKRPAVYRGS